MSAAAAAPMPITVLAKPIKIRFLSNFISIPRRLKIMHLAASFTSCLNLIQHNVCQARPQSWYQGFPLS
jgi:hypothetical protein